MTYSRLHKYFPMVFVVLSAIMLTLPAHSQVRADDRADQLEALKIELEEAKRLRDRIVSKRWEDRRVDMEAREKFNQEYDEIKLRVETQNFEGDRLHEELQGYLRDAERWEADLESEQRSFLALNGLMLERMQILAAQLDKGFPAKMTERLERLNRLRQAGDIKKDSPHEVLRALLEFEKAEIRLSREVVAEPASFVGANDMPSQGTLLRLGAITKAYRDQESGRVGLLLTSPSVSGTRYEWREDIPISATEALSKALDQAAARTGETFLVPVDLLPNQTQGKGYTQQEKLGFWGGLIAAIKIGGVFMIPLLILPVVIAILFTRKITYLTRRRSANPDVYANAIKALEAGNYDETLAICEKRPHNLVMGLIKTVASNRDNSRQQAEKSVQEVMLREIPALEKHLTTISVLGAAAPLLGLLGTVSGLIAMFHSITQFGVNDPKLLAGGIGEALITTEAGLIIAVPALLVHNYLANRVDRIVNEMQLFSVKSLNALWPQD